MFQELLLIALAVASISLTAVTTSSVIKKNHSENRRIVVSATPTAAPLQPSPLPTPILGVLPINPSPTPKPTPEIRQNPKNEIEEEDHKESEDQEDQEDQEDHDRYEKED